MQFDIRIAFDAKRFYPRIIEIELDYSGIWMLKDLQKHSLWYHDS